MQQLHGVISGRLRKIFKPGDPVWNPGRPASPTTAEPVPSHVQGQSMTGRKSRKK